MSEGERDCGGGKSGWEREAMPPQRNARCRDRGATPADEETGLPPGAERGSGVRNREGAEGDQPQQGAASRAGGETRASLLGDDQEHGADDRGKRAHEPSDAGAPAAGGER